MKSRIAVYTLATLVAMGSVPALAQQPSSPSGSQPPAASPSDAQQPASSPSQPSYSPSTPSSGSMPAQPAVSSSGAQGQSLEIASDSIIGTTVRDSQGKDVGSVSKLMIDPSQGKVTSVLIRRGGTLGVGAKEMAVPWSAVQIRRDQNQKMVVTLQQPLLEEAPAASPKTNDSKAKSEDKDRNKK